MPRSRRSDIHGFLVVDKPSGWTSHDIVARVRKLTGVRRVGHAGTLDPFATGVLVLGVGKATRLLQYVQGAPKTYLATLQLGKETDTLDPEGTVVAETTSGAWPERDGIQQAIERFVGVIEQTPPAHSAIHIDGKRAYERARSGERFEIPARSVTIESIEVARYDPPHLELEVSCQAGTYIRSLARDIGRSVETYAYCEALRRVAIGAFSVSEAIDITTMEDQAIRDRWDEISLPPDVAVRTFPSLRISGDQVAAWYHGQSLPDVPGTPDSDDGSLVRVYSADGTFAGLGTFDEGHGLRPVLVFATG